MTGRMLDGSNADTDGNAVITLVFESAIPDHNEVQEVARLMTSEEHTRRIIDLLCKQLNYFPNEPDVAPDSTPKKKPPVKKRKSKSR